jgi:Fe-S-cluster containining protein
MADTIILDPMDIYLLTRRLDTSAADLLSRFLVLELGVVDGIILPHIRMDGTSGRCPLLTDAGRCSVHDSRPGFCRLFPLGRYYENRSFRYFLQVNECRRTNRSKVKVRKWIGMADFDRYETFIRDWHYFLKDLQESPEEKGMEREKQVNTLILNTFFFRPYDTRADFYPQFYGRLEEVSASL